MGRDRAAGTACLERIAMGNSCIDGLDCRTERVQAYRTMAAQ